MPDPKINPAEQFAAFMEERLGCSIEAPLDGKFHRFEDPEKRRGNRNCFAMLTPDGSFGCYGNWATDEKYYWFGDTAASITQEEHQRLSEKIATAFAANAEQRRRDQDAAANKVRAMLDQAGNPRADHAYLLKKQVPPSNARQYGEHLLIPLQNVEGEVRNVQKIHPSGKKRFQKDAEVSGNFALIGADTLPNQGSIVVCEGWATGVTLNQSLGWPVAAAMNASNLVEVAQQLRRVLPSEVTIIVAADDDRRTRGNPGLAYAYLAADITGAGLKRPLFPCSDCECTDFNDLAGCPKAQSSADIGELPATTEEVGFIPLTTTLPPVKPLVEAMLPRSFVGFVTTSAERMQIPPDYLAVAAVAVAAGILGGKVGIHPKQLDPWLVVATVWAGLVGGPSTMKSATLSAAKKPLEDMETELAAEFETAVKRHAFQAEVAELEEKEAREKAKELYKKDPDKAFQLLDEAEFDVPAPVLRRLCVNDATIEKLGEIMRDNPNGLILIRDELSGWLAKLADEDHQGERAYYLECFEGQNPFVWDRIGRGTVRIERCILSILGGIQPSKLAPVIQAALNGTTDDGLIQRFQLSVWPDVRSSWKWIDKPRDEAAYQAYSNALKALHDIPTTDSKDALPALRFTASAQKLYRTWMEALQQRIRSDEDHPVLQSHLQKLPKTVAGLALLFELLDGGRKAVGDEATLRALLWADYLISHAERIYSVSNTQAVSNAKTILARRNKLPELFAARDVSRKNWAGMTSGSAVTVALELLVEHRYLSVIKTQRPEGGRPTSRYRWNPGIPDKS
ncbi:conserved hypothetical protein [Luminiphilus syltensis NOR5-1B]|uniref:Toprim domain-containing protein n=1 Tax=Luminiphilus syltensis NOR5-1B TaxID=565045 RepID=B8KVT7_9GAMM|nr:DUF3987 domain-containing protein [Luminiphilus syltensis]EED35856.1 conserved hypothetical protein [Luminiphilus syltensis NOR5-1B]